MYTRELQNNMSILNVFKQTGQANLEKQTSNFSDVMNKRFQSNVSTQTQASQSIKSNTFESSKPETKPVETPKNNIRERTDTVEEKKVSQKPDEPENQGTQKKAEVKSSKKPSSESEKIQTDEDEIKSDLMKKLKVTEDELDQLTALLGLDLTQLQSLITSGNADESIFQDICTTMSQIDIESSLKSSDEIDPKLMETLKTQLESLLQVLKNTSNESQTSERDFLKVFTEKLELLLNDTNASSKSLEMETTKASEQVEDVVEEVSVDLLEKVKSIVSKDDIVSGKMSSDEKGLVATEAKVSVEALKPTEAEQKLNQEVVLSKEQAPKVVTATDNMGSSDKGGSEDSNAEQTETLVSVSSDGDLVITKSISETNTILDQITMKQPSSITNGTQNVNGASLRQNVFNQILDSVKANIKLDDNGSHMLMKLKPEQLGSVELKISIHKGIVQAEINVENEMVKATVESNLDNLKQSLSQKGYQLNQINVSIDSGKKEQEQQFNFKQNSKAKKSTVLEEVENITDTLLSVSSYQNDGYETSTINYYA